MKCLFLGVALCLLVQCCIGCSIWSQGNQCKCRKQWRLVEGHATLCAMEEAAGAALTLIDRLGATMIVLTHSPSVTTIAHEMLTYSVDAFKQPMFQNGGCIE